MKIDKYLYIRKTPTWKVRLLYILGIFSWILVVWGYWGAIFADPFFTFFVTPIVFLLTIYHFTSFGLNLFYKQFSESRHKELVRACWQEYSEPSVDIFLPICGEEMDVLRNTWANVAKLDYANFRVYVLDDSKTENDEHRDLAHKFGFTYFERPNKGEMKKAGNLKYAYERTEGQFIAIFDADFAPHPDFLKETVPYMLDAQNGIVQTPQYFFTDKESYQKSPIAYNAAFAEEPFYRFIQVTRSRFGGAICCGSNALYRRSALEAIGGPVQIEYSEDAQTGFAMTCKGYRVHYVPVLLAVGLCPDNPYTFFHQQHRWCMGSMYLMLSKKFWFAPIPWRIKFCYVTGFLFYAHHPLVIVFSFQLFWTLFLYNDIIPLTQSLLFIPHIAFALGYVFFFPIAKLKPGYFNIVTARTYAYAHAVKTALLGKSVAWISTNAKHHTLSHAFRQTRKVVGVYVLLYLILMLIGIRTGDLHFFNWHYYSVEFWIFWNFILAAILYVQLSRTARHMKPKTVKAARVVAPGL